LKLLLWRRRRRRIHFTDSQRQRVRPFCLVVVVRDLDVNVSGLGNLQTLELGDSAPIRRRALAQLNAIAVHRLQRHLTLVAGWPYLERVSVGTVRLERVARLAIDRNFIACQIPPRSVPGSISSSHLEPANKSVFPIWKRARRKVICRMRSSIFGSAKLLATQRDRL